MIRFACPRCNAVLKAPKEKAGKKSNCPLCGQRMQLPTLPPTENTMLASPLGVPPSPINQITARVPLRIKEVRGNAAPKRGRPLRWGIFGGVALVALVVIVIVWRGREFLPGNRLAEIFEPDDGVAMIRRHPFFAGKVSRRDVDKILDEMLSHASGFLFLNDSGKCVYLPGESSGARATWPILVEANAVNQQVQSLGPNTLLVHRFPATRQDCIRVLNDGLSGETVGQITQQNLDTLNSLSKIQLPNEEIGKPLPSNPPPNQKSLFLPESKGSP
jgi:hypothetical protein